MAWSKKEEELRDSKRPIEYTQELGDLICEMIGDGLSLRTVLLEEGMPAGRYFFKWLRENTEFSKQYARACEERTEAMNEDIQHISDSVDEKNSNAIQKARLQVDTRKWIMAKMKPKKYGDKLDVTTDGKPLPTPIYGGKSSESSGPGGK